jgi:UDP-2,3-diacylglucosamine pyrophosphatase LpxH
MNHNTYKKRDIEIVVISDIHLGAFGCHAKELLQYLKSINPKMLILNGDIIDIWQFRKRFFPTSHQLVIRHITDLITKRTKVVYITGNHDELLRKFVKFNLGSFQLVNKLLLDLNGEKVWIFHGDVFDITMQYSKWLAKLGSVGYDMLIMLNSIFNFMLTSFGREKISFSKRIKNSVKSAVSYIGKFEETAADIAISKGYSHVICGHIHQPEMRTISNSQGEVVYLNSGDWVESLSSLEYNNGEWRIYNYKDDPIVKQHHFEKSHLEPLTNHEMFESLLQELKMA